MKSSLEGTYIVAKFFLSKAPDGSFNCISRTLGKFSVIDNLYKDVVGHREMWVCQIIKEIKPGQNHGAFILKPVEKIDPEKIRKIIPGFYDLTVNNGAAILKPNMDESDYWVLSKSTRQIFSKKYYAVIVPINYKEVVINAIST